MRVRVQLSAVASRSCSRAKSRNRTRAAITCATSVFRIAKPRPLRGLHGSPSCDPHGLKATMHRPVGGRCLWSPLSRDGGANLITFRIGEIGNPRGSC